jgi:hypothetical protein
VLPELGLIDGRSELLPQMPQSHALLLDHTSDHLELRDAGLGISAVPPRRFLHVKEVWKLLFVEAQRGHRNAGFPVDIGNRETGLSHGSEDRIFSEVFE